MFGLHIRRGHMKHYSAEKPLLGRHVGSWVWPQAVTARKGRLGQKGVIPAQVDASKVVPLLSAALIELDERLAAVEARK